MGVTLNGVFDILLVASCHHCLHHHLSLIYALHAMLQDNSKYKLSKAYHMTLGVSVLLEACELMLSLAAAEKAHCLLTG